MATKSLLDVIKQVKQKTSNSVIQTILGRNKFVMLNLNMLKKLGPNTACFLTFILDRADIQDKVGISPYTQRVVEKQLSELEIMIVVEEKLKDNQTRNRYYIDIYKLDEYLGS